MFLLFIQKGVIVTYQRYNLVHNGITVRYNYLKSLLSISSLGKPVVIIISCLELTSRYQFPAKGNLSSF